MNPRRLLPMADAARRLPWHVEVPAPPLGLGNTLAALLAHCRQLDSASWYWPTPGGAWAFADRTSAEAFAEYARRLLGDGITVRDSRATQAPPWAGTRR